MKSLVPSLALPLLAVVGVAAFAFGACTPKEKEQSVGGGLPPSEACSKLEAIYGKGAFPARQKDECLGTFATFGPNMKVCMDACVNTSKTEPQFKDCSAVCNGRPNVPPLNVPPPPTSAGAPVTNPPY